MITLIDYGMGNLRNVERAFVHEGASIERINNGAQLQNAHAIILPGVGNFGDGMRELHKRGFVDVLRKKIASGTPIFGICLGMQMLFEHSHEAIGVEGLGLLEGGVYRFAQGDEKVPHMGWNCACVQKEISSFFDLTSIADAMYYFVHSYYVVPTDPSVTAMKTHYMVDFTSAVSTKNIFATQFHPEKSQDVGLKLIRAFIEQTKNV